MICPRQVLNLISKSSPTRNRRTLKNRNSTSKLCIEDRKIELEKSKAKWAAISVWITSLSILGSVAIAAYTIRNSENIQRETAKAQFKLKAAEIVLQSNDPALTSTRQAE